jgi:hemerythrin superfamily protein
MSDLSHHLKKDHRWLLQLAAALEQAVSAEFTHPGTSAARWEIQELLAQLIELLNAHGQKEEVEFFPTLRARLPESDRWQLKMVEVQDEAILMLANDLYGWSTGASSFPPEWVQENSARLLRWLQEHVVVEEERLFPRLDDPPHP